MAGFCQSRDFLVPFLWKLRYFFALCLVNLVTQKIIKEFALCFYKLATVINVGNFVCSKAFLLNLSFIGAFSFRFNQNLFTTIRCFVITMFTLLIVVEITLGLIANFF